MMGNGVKASLLTAKGVKAGAPGRVLVLFLFLLLALGSFTALRAERKADGCFRIGRVRYGGGGDWYGDPSSLANLLKALEKRLGWAVAEREDVVSFKDDGVFFYPLVYMTGHGELRFTPEEVERIRLYLDNGGFLWADDNFGMDKSFRRELGKIFPDEELVEIPFDHAIYHGLYEFPAGLPKIHEHDGGPPRGLGILRKGRLVLFYSFDTDIGDGLEDADVHGDPPEKREAALRMALNVVSYVLSH